MKKSIIIFIVLIMILCLLLIVIKEKNDNKKSVNETLSTQLNNDTGNYTIYNQEGDIIAEDISEESVKIYLDNPDYNPNPIEN